MNARSPLRPLILCVDNREAETELALLKKVLRRVGYRVLTTTNAYQALEIFRKNHVDLVLTEQLATSGGPAIPGLMKRLKPEVPVAIYSADWEESVEDRRYADIFITKLASVDELLLTIQDLLGEDSTPDAMRLAA